MRLNKALRANTNPANLFYKLFHDLEKLRMKKPMEQYELEAMDEQRRQSADDLAEFFDTQDETKTKTQEQEKENQK